MDRAGRRFAAALACACALCAWHRLPAQTADDLAAAVDKKGCASIPYQDLKDVCTREQSEADKLCKDDAWACTGLETKALRGDIGAANGTIEGLKNEQDDMRRRESGAGDDKTQNLQLKVGDLEGVIVQNSAELVGLEQTLEAKLNEIDLRVTKGRQCRNALIGVRDAFKSATRNARYDAEGAKKPSADQLIEKWTKARDDREKALGKVVEGLEQCEKRRAGDL